MELNKQTKEDLQSRPMLPIPAKWVDDTPTTISVDFPARWIANYFEDWVSGAFTEMVLANEGLCMKPRVDYDARGRPVRISFICEEKHAN